MTDHNIYEQLWRKHWFTKDLPLKIIYDNTCIISDLYGVRGFLIPGDVYFLWYLGFTLPKNGKYLEVGSWVGLSGSVTAFGLISNSNFNAKVFCVDTWEVMQEQENYHKELKGKDLFDIFKSNIDKLKVSKYISPIKGKSIEVAKSISEKDFDIIFIDGEHTFEACYEDIKAWLPKLKQGGKMYGHDGSPDSGVVKALEKIKDEYGFNYSIIEPPYAHYIWELHIA